MRWAPWSLPALASRSSTPPRIPVPPLRISTCSTRAWLIFGTFAMKTVSWKKEGKKLNLEFKSFCFLAAQTYESLFLLEVFLNIGGILSSLCLLVGSLFGFRILVGQYLYWTAILIFLRATSYFMNVIPLYKTYTEQDFTIMLWGPLCIMFSGYCWLACYSFLESIPLPIKVKGKK